MNPRDFIFLDFETQSDVNLKNTGAHKYADDASTRPLVLCYLWLSDRINTAAWHEGDPIPELFRQNKIFVAHNAGFDKAIFDRFLFPTTSKQWRCSMARARQLNMPASLDALGQFLGVGGKLDIGKELIDKWSKGVRPVPPEALQQMTEYCARDVRVMYECVKKIGLLHGKEQAVWQWDLECNERGFPVDVEFAAAVDSALKTTLKPLLLNQFRKATGTDLKPTQREKFKQWFNGQTLLELDNTRKAEIEALCDPDTGEQEQIRRFGKPLPSEVLEALTVLLEYGQSSIAKYKKFVETTSDDGQCRDGFVYHKAHTGRWAGRGVQPHNLPREKFKDERFEIVRSLMVSGDITWATDEVQREIYNELPTYIRPTIAAPPGYVFCSIDFSNVEARILAWLAQETAVLETFRAVDADTEKRVPDVYERMGAAIFKMDPQVLHDLRIAKDKSAEQKRALGKGAVLGCGFGMGADKFVAVSRKEGSKEPEDLLRIAHQTFRSERRKTVQLWYAMAKAATDILCGVTESTRVSGMVFTSKQGALRIQLPSGRKLHYHNAKSGCTCTGKKWCNCHDRRRDFSWARFGKGEFRVHQTGPTTVENVVQAISRDITAEAALRVAKLFPECTISLHAHDELVYLIPEANAAETKRELMATIAQVPTWAEGLPIAVEGWVAKRFRK